MVQLSVLTLRKGAAVCCNRRCMCSPICPRHRNLLCKNGGMPSELLSTDNRDLFNVLVVGVNRTEYTSNRVRGWGSCAFVVPQASSQILDEYLAHLQGDRGSCDQSKKFSILDKTSEDSNCDTYHVGWGLRRTGFTNDVLEQTILSRCARQRCARIIDTCTNQG